MKKCEGRCELNEGVNVEVKEIIRESQHVLSMLVSGMAELEHDE